MIYKIRRPSPINKPKISAFPWYGGKYSHLRWLLPLLPPSKFYCEPFSGSAAILLNREPAEVETINDIDGDVVNFFRILRDQPDELIYRLKLTPYAREEYWLAMQAKGEDIEPVERARMFFLLTRMTRQALAQTATLGRWKYAVKESSGGMASCVASLINGVEGLWDVAERLIKVQIDNRPADELIEIHDDKQMLFYCDPPYLLESRTEGSDSYSHEMSTDSWLALAYLLCRCNSRVAVSGYAHPLMDQMFSGWRKVVGPEKQLSLGGKHKDENRKSIRQEVLWCNFDY